MRRIFIVALFRAIRLIRWNRRPWMLERRQSESFNRKCRDGKNSPPSPPLAIITLPRRTHLRRNHVHLTSRVALAHAISGAHPLLLIHYGKSNGSDGASAACTHICIDVMESHRQIRRRRSFRQMQRKPRALPTLQFSVSFALFPFRIESNELKWNSNRTKDIIALISWSRCVRVNCNAFSLSMRPLHVEILSQRTYT